jgi:hypothetical protein
MEELKAMQKEAKIKSKRKKKPTEEFKARLR